MSIHVWFDEQQVGVLRGVPTDRHEITILTQTADVAKFGPDAAEMNDIIWIPTKPRFAEIEESTLEIASRRGEMSLCENDFRRAHSIPDYAERSRDVSRMRMRICWNWRVAAPTLDQYETLFDLDSFEPL